MNFEPMTLSARDCFPSAQPADISVADVLRIYADVIVPSHARPHETHQRISQLLNFFGGDVVSAVNPRRCREYANQRSTQSMARKELEDLRAAVNFYRQEGYGDIAVTVRLPPRPEPRETWLTRSEVARLVWAAWRYREIQKGVLTDRRTRRHVARFILVSVYTGTRASATCGASLTRQDEFGYIDLERGIFYRRPTNSRKRRTKKRQTPVPLPRKLLNHLRRWKRLGKHYAVEWNGKPVRDVDKAFRNTVRDAGLPASVTPHVLRHTAATWLMQSGVDPWQAAEYLGMTLKTLVENYGHHHVDYLAGPRRAFDVVRHGRGGL